jgi:ribonuclease PH
MADEPDPIEEQEMSVLLEGVIGLHEVFSTLRRGGFTEEQSLSLIALMVKHGAVPS